MGGWPPPVQTANVSIPIDFADDIVENTETFVVMLSSNDSDVTVITPSNTTINIEDNDSEWRTQNYELHSNNNSISDLETDIDDR